MWIASFKLLNMKECIKVQHVNFILLNIDKQRRKDFSCSQLMKGKEKLSESDI